MIESISFSWLRICYLNDIDAWTERCTTADADSNQIALILRDRYAPGCYPHAAGLCVCMCMCVCARSCHEEQSLVTWRERFKMQESKSLQATTASSTICTPSATCFLSPHPHSRPSFKVCEKNIGLASSVSQASEAHFKSN